MLLAAAACVLATAPGHAETSSALLAHIRDTFYTPTPSGYVLKHCVHQVLARRQQAATCEPRTCLCLLS
jgi:hypothetical protein